MKEQWYYNDSSKIYWYPLLEMGETKLVLIHNTGLVGALSIVKFKRWGHYSEIKTPKIHLESKKAIVRKVFK